VLPDADEHIAAKTDQSGIAVRHRTSMHRQHPQL